MRTNSNNPQEQEYPFYLTMKPGAELLKVSGPLYVFLKTEGDAPLRKYVLLNKDTKQIEVMSQNDMEYMANHNTIRFMRQYGLTPDLEKILADSSDKIRELLG